MNCIKLVREILEAVEGESVTEAAKRVMRERVAALSRVEDLEKALLVALDQEPPVPTENLRYYQLLKPDTGEDVLGGSVSEKAAYIAVYPVPHPGHKLPRDLEPQESCLCYYRLSGLGATYRVLRVK
jgi:hypothetical protein